MAQDICGVALGGVKGRQPCGNTGQKRDDKKGLCQIPVLKESTKGVLEQVFFEESVSAELESDKSNKGAEKPKKEGAGEEDLQDASTSHTHGTENADFGLPVTDVGEAQDTNNRQTENSN